MKDPKKKTGKRDPLSALLEKPMEKRIVAVARDVNSFNDVYAEIDPFDLAEALGVEQARKPDNDWVFSVSGDAESIEEYASCNSPVSEIAYFLEGKIDEERFKFLEKKFAEPDAERNGFNFLTKEERILTEREIVKMRLSDGLKNGLGGVATYTVTLRRTHLRFVATIEDDGSCIYLKTPYDERNERDENFSASSDYSDSW
jgi:hypothetical protein